MYYQTNKFFTTITFLGNFKVNIHPMTFFNAFFSNTIESTYLKNIYIIL